ncbi:2,4-dihydroxyhept-2-ene-1,7-dioic acid aldolase [Mycena indigotica]|uniref:2,4-dihydroxyhept-2-ene-1,7-dioic acid aldolase n=1 Tax=Mycena indigotica TaxID=2126181 RepID=A0A8H6W2Y9_9AGAR|nr:2,4-dihydroxyhept-2-ene-1,7-dioic acid aldolase [Mycena indigotica]KAF7303689.1 2,4-dihydroxyhept-2-ene-1,7-dioic acid aldolase [Mycena indigotica]
MRHVLTPTLAASFAGPTRQQPANLRGLIHSGKILIGQVLSYPSTQVARTLAATGADWIWIDTEHVGWSPATLVECIQIISHESAGRMVPIVRVPSKTAFDYMAWSLDAGAGGVILPHIETTEEITAAVNACRFPPEGHRSFPPFTFACIFSVLLLSLNSGQIPGLTDATPPGETVYTIANKHIAIIPQVESPAGIANMDAIMALPSVDAVMIGAGDLRLELGLPVGFMGNEATFVNAMGRASLAAKEHPHKALIGAALGAEMIEERLRLGFRMLITTIDFHTLALRTVVDLSAARETVEASRYLK